MQKCARLFLLSSLMILGLSLQWGNSSAQRGDVQPNERKYFPQTGHWVMGDFLATYYSVSEPELIYGYPITESYQDPSYDKFVQYFERARFELSPDNPEELRVVVSPLGEYMYEQGRALSVPTSFPACHKFQETGKQVCYAFLDFFDAHGGVATFGYPISNFEIQEQRIVQYFQRARFEWHPELAPGQRVKLAPLGRLYFEEQGEDPARIFAAPTFGTGSNIPQPVIELRVSAYPEHGILPQGGAQSINILVLDQNFLPVSNASVQLVVDLPSDQPQHITLIGATDKNGVIAYQFNYTNQAIGVGEIIVIANYESIFAQTVTSFRIWW